MSETALLQNYLIVGAILFGIGMTGFLVRRNLIVMFLCAEMMLQGISLSLIAWGRFHSDWGGQSLVAFIVAVAACEAGIALALVLVLAKRSGALDVVGLQKLREKTIAPFVDRQVPPDDIEDDEDWPELTPAGRQPVIDTDRELHRPHV